MFLIGLVIRDNCAGGFGGTVKEKVRSSRCGLAKFNLPLNS